MKLSRCSAILSALILWGSAPIHAAQSTPVVDLLTHPQSALGVAPGGGAAFKLLVDAKPLSYDAPEILFQQSGPQADFIAGVWKDAQGLIIHQREVFFVKPDYLLVVEHLYDPKGSHEISSQLTLPCSELKDGRFDLGNGREFFVQHLAALAPAPTMACSSGLGHWSSSYSLKLPAPYTTVFSRQGGPKIEFVKAGNPMVVKCKATWPDGRVDNVGMAWESRPLHLGGKSLLGWAAIARQGPGAPADLEIQPPAAPSK